MALILIDNYQPLVISPEDGAKLWMIKKGYLQPENERWRKRAQRTRKIYLNPENAPDDYLSERKDNINHDPETVRVLVNERWVPFVETRKDLI